MPARLHGIRQSIWICTGVAAVVFAVGCGGDSENAATNQSASSNQGSSGDSDDRESPPAPLLEGWKEPAAAIIVTGEQYGYMEPCGCSENQSGGISRRADLFRQIHEKQWPVTAIDLGGVVKRDRQQSQIKYAKLIEAMKWMDYKVMGIAKQELRLGPAFLLSQHMPNPDTPDENLELIGTNSVFFDSPEFEVPVRWKAIEVGDVTIGVISILGESFQNEIVPSGASVDFSFRDVEEFVRPALEQLQDRSCELIVLLANMNLDESRTLIEKYRDFDVVVSAGGVEDPLYENPVTLGETLLVTTGHKGKYAGVIGFYPDGEQRLRFELVELNKQRFRDTSEMHDIMRAYQQELQDLQIVQNLVPITHPSGNTYTGAKVCGECHTKAYAFWKNTPHARAYDSLNTGRKGQEANWISRVHDPECLACHVTGWDPQDVVRYDSGFVDLESTAHLVGQQCENCHGPGSQHVELERLWKTDRSKVELAQVREGRRAMQLNEASAAKQVCFRCHDLDNSPHFDYDEYWKKVRHPFRD